MKLEDFTEKEQNEIKAGLSTAEITDKETTDKILALVPQDWIKKIPFFVRKHATTKTIERIANQYPALYEVAKKHHHRYFQREDEQASYQINVSNAASFLTRQAL